MTVARFNVSPEEELLESLDNYVHENKYPNRSQAISTLIDKYSAECRESAKPAIRN